MDYNEKRIALARLRPAARASAAKASQGGPGSKTKWIVLFVILSLMGGISWGAAYLGNARKVAKVEAMRSQLFTRDQNLSDEQRREIWSQYREASEQLSEAQRDELRRRGEQMFMQRMEKRLDDYFALAPAQRVAALDKDIDDMERERQKWEKRREEREKERAAEAASGKSPPATGGSGEASSGDRSRGPGSGSGSGDSRGGSRGPRTDEQRKAFRQKMLDRSSPEMRAKMAQHRIDMDKRRAERGLPPTRTGGRF